MPKRIGRAERAVILSRLSRVLSARREIAVAVVHGGFIESSIFRDIDVAVFTGHRVPVDDEHVYAYILADELTSVAGGIPVDVVVIDNAPPDYIVNALTRGVTLVERLHGLRLHILIRALEDLERIRGSGRDPNRA